MCVPLERRGSALDWIIGGEIMSEKSEHANIAMLVTSSNSGEGLIATRWITLRRIQ